MIRHVLAAVALAAASGLAGPAFAAGPGQVATPAPAFWSLAPAHVPTPAEIDAEAARLRAALAREVPQSAAFRIATGHDWVALAKAQLLLRPEVRLERAQLLVVVDRSLSAQAIALVVARPDRAWEVLGATHVSTGQEGRFDHYVTPTGVFLHTADILDYRAEGTVNENGIRGLGVKGMRVWDFGWQMATKGWKRDGEQGEIRMEMHATDPTFLASRIGRTASQGCIRIPEAMNRFLDRHGVLDADYEHAAVDDIRYRALLLPRAHAEPAGRQHPDRGGQRVADAGTADAGDGKQPVAMKLSVWMLAAAALWTTGAMAGDYVPARDTVAVSGGTVAAAADSAPALRVFKGLPFAAPPVGALRWKAPQPVVPWRSVRRSDSFAPACFMGIRPGGAVGAILYQESEAQSEDCLYLNVWTGAAAGAREKRPVMMLLYGGGYLVGSGSQPNYDGTGLASKGAVVVTMNYRLGPLGFLAHPELTAESPNHASGDYALLDAIAALQWIKANIAAFGGDPDNVTLYSQSAGAGLASVLLASPLAAGLFHRMDLESFGSMPAGSPITTLAEAEAAGVVFARNVGAADLAALRAKLPQDVMAGEGAVNRPIVDGAVLPDQLDRMFATGRINDVPLLAGWNADEGTPYPPFATTLAQYDAAAAARYGDLAERFRQVYPAAGDAEVRAMAYAPMRDGLFAWQPWTVARAHAAAGKAKTFLYLFSRHPAYYPDQHFNEQDPPARYGAYHTLEQVYLYNNLDRSAPPRPYDAIDRRLADAMSSYLVNFARSGDPNGGALPPWPTFVGPASQAMLFGDEIGAGAVPYRPALDFFDAFYTRGLGRKLPF